MKAPHQQVRPKAITQARQSRGCARKRPMLASGFGCRRVAVATAALSCRRMRQKLASTSSAQTPLKPFAAQAPRR